MEAVAEQPGAGEGGCMAKVEPGERDAARGCLKPGARLENSGWQGPACRLKTWGVVLGPG